MSFPMPTCLFFCFANTLSALCIFLVGQFRPHAHPPRVFAKHKQRIHAPPPPTARASDFRPLVPRSPRLGGAAFKIHPLSTYGRIIIFNSRIHPLPRHIPAGCLRPSYPSRPGVNLSTRAMYSMDSGVPAVRYTSCRKSSPCLPSSSSL